MPGIKASSVQVESATLRVRVGLSFLTETMINEKHEAPNYTSHSYPGSNISVGGGKTIQNGIHLVLYVTAGAYYIKPPTNEVRKEAAFLFFLSSIPTPSNPIHPEQSTLCHCTHYSDTFCHDLVKYLQCVGSFQRHSEPFHSHPPANERKLLFAAAS